MSLNNKESKARKLAVFAIMLDIVTFALGFGFIFIAIGHDANSATECTSGNGLCPNTPLGVWKNMPPSTSCDLASVNVSAPVCELMGNQTYRGQFGPGNMVGYLAYLSVGCIVSSSSGSLQLQYALYSAVSFTNTTNFQTIGGSILLTGCPADLISTAGTLNATAQGANLGYIFRAVGFDGGGAGDNPRFSYVSVIVERSETRLFLPHVGGIGNNFGTASFIGAIDATVPPVVATSASFAWSVTNASATNPGCGTNVTGGTDVCWQKGTATCTIAIAATSCTVTVTYTTAFTGTVGGSLTSRTAPQGVNIPYGSVVLLKTQTVTV